MAGWSSTKSSRLQSSSIPIPLGSWKLTEALRNFGTMAKGLPTWETFELRNHSKPTELFRHFGSIAKFGNLLRMVRHKEEGNVLLWAYRCGYVTKRFSIQLWTSKIQVWNLQEIRLNKQHKQSHFLWFFILLPKWWWTYNKYKVLQMNPLGTRFESHLGLGFFPSSQWVHL